jgi:hypothetical protein
LAGLLPDPMCGDVDPRLGMSTEYGPAYHWKLVWSFGRSFKLYGNRTMAHEDTQVQLSAGNKKHVQRTWSE